MRFNGVLFKTMFPSSLAIKCSIFVCVAPTCIDVTMRKKYLGMLFIVLGMSLCTQHGIG